MANIVSDEVIEEQKSLEEKAEVQDYFGIPKDGSNPFEEPEEEKTPEKIEEEGKGVAMHIAETFGSVGNGLLRATQNTGNLYIDYLNEVDPAAKAFKKIIDMDGDFPRIDFANNPKYVHQPQNGLQVGVSALTQFLAPMGVLSKATKGIKAAGVTANFMKMSALGGAVDFAAIDPDGAKLADMLQSFTAIKYPVLEYLGSNPNDTKMEGRFKNVLDGILIGTAIEGGVLGAKALANSKLSDAAFKYFKTLRAKRYAKSVAEDTAEIVKRMGDEGIVDVELGGMKKIPDETITDPAAKEAASKEAADAEAKQAKRIEEIEAEVKAEDPNKQSFKEETIHPEDEPLISFNDVDGRAKINYHRVTSIEDVNKIIQAIHKQTIVRINKAKRGVVTDAMVEKNARERHMTVDEYLNTPEGSSGDAELMFAGNQILQGVTKYVVQLARGLKKDPENLQKALQLAESIDQYRLVQATLAGVEGEVGRAHRMTGIARGTVSEQNRAIKELMEMTGGNSDMMDFVNDLLFIAKNDELADAVSGVKTIDRINTIKNAILLSGSGTHKWNFIANVLKGGMLVAERAGAEISGSIRRGVFGADGIDSVARGETWALVQGMKSDISGAFAAIKKPFKDDVVSSKYASDLPQRPTEPAKNIFEAGFRHLETLPFKLLDGGDQFFKTIFRNGELSALAHRKGYRRQLESRGTKKWGPQGMPDDEVAKIVQRELDNPTVTNKRLAEETSNEFLGTKELDQFTERYYNPASVQSFIKGNAVFNFFIPFTKFALNEVEFVLARTPIPHVNEGLGFAHLGKEGNLLNRVLTMEGGISKLEGAARDKFMGKLGVSTMGLYLVGDLTQRGYITHSGSIKRSARSAEKAAGVQQYSLNVPIGEPINLNRAGGAGLLGVVGAEVAAILSMLTSDEEEKGKEFLIRVGAIVSTAFTPQILTENVGLITDAMRGDKNAIERLVGGMGSGIVPTKSFNRLLVDPVQRSTMADPNHWFPLFDKLVRSMKASTVGLSSDLPPLRNVFGETREFFSLVDDPNAVAFGEHKNDPISKEIRRMNLHEEGVAEVNIDMPQKFKKVLAEDGFTTNIHKFSPEEYDRFVTLSGGHDLDFQPVEGKTLREALNELVKSGYDDGLGQRLDTIEDIEKAAMIEELVEEYRAEAMEQMGDEFPAIMDKLYGSEDASTADTSGVLDKRSGAQPNLKIP